MTPGDPVVGSTVLRRPAIQSPNYVPGSAGWSINADGSAEFNDVTIRGAFVNTTQLSYSGTPAAGNLVQSSGFTTGGTDGFGNSYLAGQATYGTAEATAVAGGEIGIYSGSLSGGWTLEATITTDVFGDLILAVTGGGSIQLASVTVAGSDLTVDGTFTASGSTGGPAGTGFFDTQGLASGSYGSTHQHTLPNFPTATHTHPL